MVSVLDHDDPFAHFPVPFTQHTLESTNPEIKKITALDLISFGFLIQRLLVL